MALVVLGTGPCLAFKTMVLTRMVSPNTSTRLRFYDLMLILSTAAAIMALASPRGNVEVVSNIRLVKYIFKYAYKGHDRAHVELGQRADEIQQHIDARYLGAAEAVWRLFEFPIHGASHSVERLSVHLPGQQLVHLKLVWRHPRCKHRAPPQQHLQHGLL